MTIRNNSIQLNLIYLQTSEFCFIHLNSLYNRSMNIDENIYQLFFNNKVKISFADFYPLML